MIMTLVMGMVLFLSLATMICVPFFALVVAWFNYNPRGLGWRIMFGVGYPLILLTSAITTILWATS